MKVVPCGLFCSSQKRSCQVKKKKNQETITLLTFILIKSHNDPLPNTHTHTHTLSFSYSSVTLCCLFASGLLTDVSMHPK